MTSPRIARAAALLLALAALILCSASGPAQAKGTMDIVKHIDGDPGALEVVTYVDGPAKIGLLGIIQGDTRVSFAGDAKLWAQLVTLFKNGSGSLTETEGKAKCKITLKAGKPLHIVIDDPSKGPVEFTVPDDAAEALVEALDKVDTFLKD